MSVLRWRRAFRFSLRMMFLAFTVSAVGIYMVGVPIRDYHVNKDVDEQLSSVGGRVTKEPIAGGCFVYFCPKFASRIVRVDLVNMHVGETELKHLSLLKEMHSLYLFYTDVNDSAIAHISVCPQLRTLDLDGTQVGDAGLKDIYLLSRLQWLGLRHTKISDAGLKHLYSLNSLETVVLWETQVTEEGIRELRAALPQVIASRVPLEDMATAE